MTDAAPLSRVLKIAGAVTQWRPNSIDIGVTKQNDAYGAVGRKPFEGPRH